MAVCVATTGFVQCFCMQGYTGTGVGPHGCVPGSGGSQGPVVPDPGGQVTISPCVSLPCANGGYVKLNMLVSNVNWFLP